MAGQRDRFATSLSLGLPGRQAELALLGGTGGIGALDSMGPVAPLDAWRDRRARTAELYLHPTVAAYALDLVDAVRDGLRSRQPLSPRASLALVRLARAHACSDDRDHVRPDDVGAVVAAALAHRIVDATNDDLPAARARIVDLAHQVPAPPVSQR